MCQCKKNDNYKVWGVDLVKVLNVFGNVLSICEGKKDLVSGISFFIRNNIYLILLPMLHWIWSDTKTKDGQTKWNVDLRHHSMSEHTVSDGPDGSGGWGQPR